MIDFEKFEKQCDAQRKINLNYLDEFRRDLEDAGLADKTIRRHLSNTEFYINTYLLHDEVLPMKEGCRYEKLDDFIGWFFIRKCTWSTPATIKTTAASLKKFYKCMMDKDFVTEADYKEVIDTIRDFMDTWLDDCKCYNRTGHMSWE